MNVRSPILTGTIAENGDIFSKNIFIPFLGGLLHTVYNVLGTTSEKKCKKWDFGLKGR